MLVHDIRNPLSGSMAAVSLLEMEPELTDGQRLLVGKALQCLEKQSEMLEDILATAAAQNGCLQLNKESFALGDCVREQVLLQEEVAAFRRITIDCQGLDGNWQVNNADRRLLAGHCNLLMNALKYAKSDSTINVWLGAPGAAPLLPAGCQQGPRDVHDHQ